MLLYHQPLSIITFKIEVNTEHVTPSIPASNFNSTGYELGLTPSNFTSTSLSSKQIQEITNDFIYHLQKHDISQQNYLTS
jgi:hypothetical protein